MRRLLAIALLVLTGCGSVAQQKYPVTASDDDSNTHYVIPKNNSTFTTDLQAFLGKEQAARDVDFGFGNFVVSGCLGPTAAGLTHTLSACTAYNAGLPSTCGVGNAKGLPISGQGSPDCTGGNSITYPNSSTCWVAMDENTSGNNAGIPTFTRVSGTHYLTDCGSVAQPTMAVDSQLLMKVVTSGGAITAVTDLRATSVTVPGGSIVDPLVINNINPKPPLNGGQSIGPFNGSRSGEKNLKDFNPAASLATGTCTSTSGQSTLTNCTLPSGFTPASMVGLHIAGYKMGAAPQSSVPVMTIIPTSTNSTTGGTGNTYYHNGCQVINGTGSATSGQAIMVLSNPFLYEVGQVVTTAAPDSTAYTISAIDHNSSLATISPVAASSFHNLALTGANCSTTRRYKMAWVEASGAISAFTAVGEKTVAASALNPENFDVISAPWDAHAVGAQVCACEGGGCPPILVGGDYPVQPYNSQNLGGGDAVLNDILVMFNAGKTAPINANYHDFGLGDSATDFIDGTTCTGNENGTLLAKVLSVTGTNPYTLTLDAAAGANVSGGTIGFDDEPAHLAAATAALDVNGNYTTLYEAAGAYPIAQTFTPPAGVSFRMVGDGGFDIGANTQHQPRSQIVWRGRAFQGIAVNLDRQTGPAIDNVAVDSVSGSTMAVAVGVDGTGGSPPTSQGRFSNMFVGLAAYDFLLANVNGGNVEFFGFDHDTLNCNTGVGSYGIYANSGNSRTNELKQVNFCNDIGIMLAHASVHGIDSWFSTPGSIGIWSTSFNSSAVVWDGATPTESIARFFYTPFAGGAASNRLSLANEDFLNTEFLPDCNFMTTGNGTLAITATRFEGTDMNQGLVTGGTATCPNGFVRSGNSGSTSLMVGADSWAQSSNAYANFTNVSPSPPDQYVSLVDGSFQIEPAVPASIPACPMTLTATDTVTPQSCIGIPTGSPPTYTFPVADVNLTRGLLTVSAGSVTCRWHILGGGEHILMPSEWASGTVQQCNDTAANTGTINLDISGGNFVLVNRTGNTGMRFVVDYLNRN